MAISYIVIDTGFPVRDCRFFDTNRANYNLANNSRIPVVDQIVFCIQCDRVSDGEVIEPLELIDRAAEFLLQERSALYSDLIDRASARVREFGRYASIFSRYNTATAVSTRRTWRVRRQSPPRCMTCGSTDIVPFPDSEPRQITLDRRVITIVFEGFADVLDDKDWLLNPEGERLSIRADAWRSRRP